MLLPAWSEVCTLKSFCPTCVATDIQEPEPKKGKKEVPALEQKEIPAKTPAATLAATQPQETETPDSGTPATGPLRPTLPEPDYAGSALDTISKIMAWATPQVLEQIKKKGLGQWAQLSDVNPLAWNADIAKASARTFKEMWDCGHAASSLSQNGLYEAGGSLFWIQPLPEPSQVSGQVSWSNVVKGLALLNPKKMHGGTSRILWPFCLETCAKDYQVTKDKYPVGLQLLHGHAVVFSWWLDMYQALVDTDEVKIGQLIECALCATVQVRLLNTAAEIAAASIEAAAQTWELASCLSEPFHLLRPEVDSDLGRHPEKGQGKPGQNRDLPPGQLQEPTQVPGQGLEQDHVFSGSSRVPGLSGRWSWTAAAELHVPLAWPRLELLCPPLQDGDDGLGLD